MSESYQHAKKKELCSFDFWWSFTSSTGIPQVVAIVTLLFLGRIILDVVSEFIAFNRTVSMNGLDAANSKNAFSIKVHVSPVHAKQFKY